MSLRSKLIRLAHSNPDIRPHILPLLRTAKSDIADQLQGAFAQHMDSARERIAADDWTVEVYKETTTCEGCGRSTSYESLSRPKWGPYITVLPDGWGFLAYDHELVCPECIEGARKSETWPGDRASYKKNAGLVVLKDNKGKSYEGTADAIRQLLSPMTPADRLNMLAPLFGGSHRPVPLTPKELKILLQGRAVKEQQNGKDLWQKVLRNAMERRAGKSFSDAFDNALSLPVARRFKEQLREQVFKHMTNLRDETGDVEPKGLVEEYNRSGHELELHVPGFSEVVESAIGKILEPIHGELTEIRLSSDLHVNISASFDNENVDDLVVEKAFHDSAIESVKVTTEDFFANVGFQIDTTNSPIIKASNYFDETDLEAIAKEALS